MLDRRSEKDRRRSERRMRDKIEKTVSKPPDGKAERRSDYELIFELLVALDTLQYRYTTFVHRVLVGLLIILAMFAYNLWRIEQEASNRIDANRELINLTCGDLEELKRAIRATIAELIPGEESVGEIFALGQFAEGKCPKPGRRIP